MKGWLVHFENLKKLGFYLGEPNTGELLDAGEEVALDRNWFRRISKLFDELEQKHFLVIEGT